MKTKREDIEKMLKRLCKDWWVEFSDIRNHYNLDDALKQSKNMYFRAWVSRSNRMRFNKDEDIIEKNYFVIDLDIRENVDWDISNEEIKDRVPTLIDILKDDELLSEWSYIIYTGNWLHIYYIWDFIDVNVKQYSTGVSSIFDMFYDVVNRCEQLKPDKAMQNIARYSRLPWTTNFKMLEKHHIEPQEVEILSQQEKSSRLVSMINELWKKKIEESKIEMSRQKENNESKYFKKKINDSWLVVYEWICEIPLNDIICEEFWFTQKSNDKYFYWAGKKEPQGLVYHNDNNTVFHWWCSSWVWWEVGKTYNTFSYIREREKLSDKDTFDRFKERYNNIKDLDKKPKTKKNKEYTIISWSKYNLKDIVPYTRWTNNLDKKFWRYDRWILNVIVWESQMWKTEYTLFQAKQNANKWYKVLYLALEMTKEKMIARTAKKKAGITKIERDDKTFWKSKKEKFIEEYNKLDKYENLNIVSIKNACTQNIEEIILWFKDKWYELFYIDNLWFLKWDNEEIVDTAEAVRILSNITNENNITINLIHHLNKWSDKDRKKPRGLASIRSSWKIENDADNIIQVWRNLDTKELLPDEKAQVSIILQKDREYWEPSQENIYFNKWDYNDIYIENY